MHTKPIKIAHLVRAVDIGGLEMVVLDLVRFRSQPEFDCTLVCLEQPGELAERFERAGARVIALGLTGRSLPRRVLSLSRTLNRLRPNILHTHNCGPHFNGALAASLTRIRALVHTKHGRNYEGPPQTKLLLQNKIASRLSSKIVCVSHDAAEVARNVEKVPQNRISVIHNGIELGRFEMNPAPCANRESIRAIHVARLNDVKDQCTLLRSVQLVVDQLPDFQLDIVGDGPAGDKVRKLCIELSLQSHVRFHGMRDDVPKLLKTSDLFVLSSLSEGISLTLLEAMASGLPVVATDVGGNREVVVNCSTGLLVPPRDPIALATAILKICANGYEARQLGLRGRQRVEQFFSVRSMVTAYENIYRDLLGLPTSLSNSEVVPPNAPSETVLSVG